MSLLITRHQLQILQSLGVRINHPPEAESLRIPNAPFGMETHTNHPYEGAMPLGAYSYSHSYAPLVSEIGRYVSIGAGLKVTENTHPTDRISTSPAFYAPRKFTQWGGAKAALPTLTPFEPVAETVTIGHDVWIGGDVRIRAGVHIGTGAIIAAGSNVTKDVPEFAIVGGVPAKVIRMRFSPLTIARIRDLAWWRFAASDIAPLDTGAPERFLDALDTQINAGAIAERPEKRFLLRKFLRSRAFRVPPDAS
ncbi:MAG: CatB-related O-acetyltransferase [Pseudomonadota bacterium]